MPKRLLHVNKFLIFEQENITAKKICTNIDNIINFFINEDKISITNLVKKMSVKQKSNLLWTIYSKEDIRAYINIPNRVNNKLDVLKKFFEKIEVNDPLYLIHNSPFEAILIDRLSDNQIFDQASLLFLLKAFRFIFEQLSPIMKKVIATKIIFGSQSSKNTSLPITIFSEVKIDNIQNLKEIQFEYYLFIKLILNQFSPNQTIYIRDTSIDISHFSTMMLLNLIKHPPYCNFEHNQDIIFRSQIPLFKLLAEYGGDIFHLNIEHEPKISDLLPICFFNSLIKPFLTSCKFPFSEENLAKIKIIPILKKILSNLLPNHLNNDIRRPIKNLTSDYLGKILIDDYERQISVTTRLPQNSDLNRPQIMNINLR